MYFGQHVEFTDKAVAILILESELDADSPSTGATSYNLAVASYRPSANTIREGLCQHKAVSDPFSSVATMLDNVNFESQPR